MQRGRGGPARVLFLHGLELGFGTTTRFLIDAAAERADIDAVHIKLKMTGLRRLLSAPSPAPVGRWDLRAWRSFHAWRGVLRPLIGPGPGRGGRPSLPLERFDVVHIMAVQRALAIPALAGRTAAKLVVNVDATTVAFDRAFGHRSSAPPLEVALERRIFRAADAVACASRWAMESVERDYGAAPEKLFLHMPCVPVGEMRARRPRGPGEPLRIVFIGNHWERKGGPRLLKWHQERWADRAELHVCSSGAPAERGARNVVWHGATPHAKLVGEILPMMDLLVMPTREDTFLIAAQEAQAAGVPVVTSRLAAIPEVVADGVSGLLCERGDDAGFIRAVESLMDDDAKRERFSRAAAARGQRELSGRIWHNHLMDQLVALADGRGVRVMPAALSGADELTVPAAERRATQDAAERRATRGAE
jgi:glycosyltransferase involved in cell wall biosynthesis